MLIAAAHRLRRLWPFGAPKRSDLPGIKYDVTVVSEGVLVIKALAPMELGRAVVQPFQPTQSCYVFDVIVDAQHRGRGIATGLLLNALRLSASESIVPVDIDPTAMSFWLRLAAQGMVPVRLGLRRDELLAIAHTMRDHAYSVIRAL